MTTKMTAPAERRAPRWLKLLNRLTRPFLRRGIGPGPHHLLLIRGRRTGAMTATPIAVLDHRGTRYIVSGYSGADWIKNYRHAGRAELRRGSRAEEVTLELIPVGERAPILRRFAKTVRGGRAFLTVAADASDEAFLEASPRHPVFRIERADPDRRPTAAAKR
jgi:hypothetical protein